MNKHRCLFIVVFFLLTVMLVTAQPALAAGETVLPKVSLGIDNINEHLPVFAGKRVGLITNATGVNSHLQSSVVILKEATNLVALFSPEHGIRGNAVAGAVVDTQIDSQTGLPVYSLYGATKKPSPEMLKDIDVLVFDIQDVGARFYTYIYTMAYAMQSCSEQGKTFVVLDRPNPVGGDIVEGGILKPGYESFIGMYPIPIRHGMTVGELARFFNKEYGIGCDLTVIPMHGWKRSMFFEQTGQPWVLTSPNIPTVDTAVVYSGIGIFGGTNLSEGVGTTKPFELVGAPWLDPLLLAKQMNEMALPGVFFRPVYFTPMHSKQQGQLCGGVQLHVTDRKVFLAVKTGVYLLQVIRNMSGEQFAFKITGNGTETIDLATGDDTLRKGSLSPVELMRRWDQEAAEFKQISRKYYLYN